MSRPALHIERIDVRGETGGLAGELTRPDLTSEGPREVVEAILARVAADGDDALIQLTAELDGVDLDRTLVDRAEITDAMARVDPALIDSLTFAAERIRSFHRSQMPNGSRHVEGATITSSYRPVGSVGCYVPGGRAAYPSTLLMTAIPAAVAGVDRIVVCCPPDRGTGSISDVTLAAAGVAGVSEVHAVGGAQAIGALAFGTPGIEAVDVICGPGNRYVAIAQRLVSGRVGVASAFAGPSEIVVIADNSVDARLAAVDVLVQAEHGPDGLAWFITWDDTVADAVERNVAELAGTLPRSSDVVETLRTAGRIVLVRDLDQALEVSDLVAPEHLQLMIADPGSAATQVRNAGAIFLGPFSPASAGDYVAGPSHVLPTHGSARFASALGVSDFLKSHHIIEFSESQFAAMAPHVERLAMAEGLQAHALSASLRSGRPETPPAPGQGSITGPLP